MEGYALNIEDGCAHINKLAKKEQRVGRPADRKREQFV